MPQVVFSRDQTKAVYGCLEFVFAPGAYGCSRCAMDDLPLCGKCTYSTRDDRKRGRWKPVRKGSMPCR